MKNSSSSARYKLVGLGLTVVAAALVVAGLMSRRLQAEHLQEGAADRNVPTVSVLSATDVKPTPLVLPARIEAWARAPIYARVSGYLKDWKVDIGAPVKAGQLLAEIETPDLDQQLLQARAELVTARSNLALSSSTAQRWKALLASDAVSKQEADEKAGDLAAKQSVVGALQANVDRVQALKQFTRLTAPFDGVVTARNTDTGALINVGGAAGSELFVISDVRKLRIYVSVPQRQVALVRPGATVQLTTPERPDQVYTATVQSQARSIAPGSGTMLVQLAAHNAKGELLPGGFATVSFDAPATGANLTLPPGAVMFGKNGVQVATVGVDNRVKLKSVIIGRDFGNVVEIAGGLDRADRVIESPPDGVANGDLVRVASVAAAPKGKS